METDRQIVRGEYQGVYLGKLKRHVDHTMDQLHGKKPDSSMASTVRRLYT